MWRAHHEQQSYTVAKRGQLHSRGVTVEVPLRRPLMFLFNHGLVFVCQHGASVASTLVIVMFYMRWKRTRGHLSPSVQLYRTANRVAVLSAKLHLLWAKNREGLNSFGKGDDDKNRDVFHKRDCVSWNRLTHQNIVVKSVKCVTQVIGRQWSSSHYQIRGHRAVHRAARPSSLPLSLTCCVTLCVVRFH